jgi:predicted TIM-barrel fold metal-dependent hydrolase
MVGAVMVFDFHARLLPGARLLSTMDDVGIARAMVVAGGVVDVDTLARHIVDGGHVDTDADNDAVLAACAGSNGRLVPMYFGNPHRNVAEYRRVAPRFRGLELSPAVHGVRFDDPRLMAFVAVAAAHGHPVYTVCLGRPGTRPGDLVGLARQFPATTFVSGHCGFIGVDTFGIAEIAPQDNIVAETSGCFSVVARRAIDLLGPERVLFGTEYPLQHPGVELAKFAALGLAPSTWRQVAWRNAHRLLGEEEAEPSRRLDLRSAHHKADIC